MKRNDIQWLNKRLGEICGLICDHQVNARIHSLHFHDGRNQFGRRTLWPQSSTTFGREQIPPITLHRQPSKTRYRGGLEHDCAVRAPRTRTSSDPLRRPPTASRRPTTALPRSRSPTSMQRRANAPLHTLTRCSVLKYQMNRSVSWTHMGSFSIFVLSCVHDRTGLILRHSDRLAASDESTRPLAFDAYFVTMYQVVCI